MPVKNIEVFFNIDSLNLKEALQELYIYKDNVRRGYEIYYNNEEQFPINLEKAFRRRYGKVKSYFTIIEDIKVQFNNEENLVKITYIMKG